MNEATELVIALSHLNNKTSKRIDGHLGMHGISFTEYLVLRHLARSTNQQSRRSDVADSVGLSASGVTRLLAPMEKIGLVQKEKAARDARVSLVKLTKAGSQIFNDTEVTVNHCAEKLFASIAPVQRDMLLELVKKMT